MNICRKVTPIREAYTIVFSLVLICLFTKNAITQSSNYRTKNVFIVVIDGIRNNEAFESGNKYLHYIWDSLRPQGTIYTNFQNRGITVTNAGHSTIASGVRQLLPNNSGIATPIQPKEPTIGEYYRKELGIPKEKVYYISGKNTIWRYPVSLYPGYGYDYAPTISLSTSSDFVTWDSTRTIMDRDHPSLSYVLFAHVDAQGHTADTTKYLTSIYDVDSLIFLLWKKIQGDPIYQDQTTMIITSDHGRHDDNHGGWQAHGDYCHGCRHIPFLAIGPDIKVDTAIDIARDQIDITPTVAHLLGFSVPLAQGTVMSEMLLVPSPFRIADFKKTMHNPLERNLSESPGISRSCAITATGSALRVVYSDDSNGRHEVYYKKSIDRGRTWITPQILFSTTDVDYLEPVITVYDDTCLYVVSTGYQYFPSDTTYRWILKGLRSTDNGESWSYPIRTDTLTNVGQKPSISANGNYISIALMNAYQIVVFKSSDAGMTFKKTVTHTGQSESPACTMMDTICCNVWHHLNSTQSPYWNILFDQEPWQSTDQFLTNNTTNSYSYDPSISDDDSINLHVVYPHLADASAGNSWKINYQRDSNFDGLFGEPTEIGQERVGFSPVVKVSNNGNIHAIWADYLDNEWSIWGTYSLDRGVNWIEPYRISSNQSFSLDPDFDVKDDTLFVVWQDYREGNWEIYFKEMQPRTSTQVKYNNSWNMISLPLTVPNAYVKDLFPSAISDAFLYNGSSYISDDTIRNMVGYWLKFTDASTENLLGFPRFDDTVDVTSGWNLIGTLTEPIPVNDILSDPPGMETSDFFGYDESYMQVDTLEPGKGYWVKVDQDGKLILSWSLNGILSQNRIKITERTEMPPMPPADLANDNRKLIPGEFYLSQNYPNPFNPITVFRYQLPIGTKVTLKVYNLLSQEIKTLVDDWQDAGYKTVEWDASNFASGVYFYRINAGSFIQTKKLILMR